MSYDFSIPATSTSTDDSPRSYEQELFEGTPYFFRVIEVEDENRIIGGLECRSCYMAALDQDHRECARFYVNLRLPSNYDSLPTDKHWMISRDMRVWQAMIAGYNSSKHLPQSNTIGDLKVLEGVMLKGEVKARQYTNKTGGTSWGYSIIYPKAYTLDDKIEEFERAKNALSNDDIPF